MDFERNELVKKVFPVLREYCETKGISFTEIDLRWGITEDEAEAGKVIPICLEEIDNCRPFFIGLLGDRYGTTVKNFSSEMLAHHSWLAEQKEISITEMEIVYGALSPFGIGSNAFFYLRSSEFYNSLPPNTSTDIFFERSEKGKLRLESLKKKIKEHPFPVEYYQNAVGLGQTILRDIKNTIDKELLANESHIDVVDPHDVFASLKGKFVFSRNVNLKKIADFLNYDNGRALIIYGEEGLGKTTLISKIWLDHFQSNNTQFESKSTNLLRQFFGSKFKSAKIGVVHFVSASKHSKWRGLITRIIEQGNKKLNLDFHLPESPNEFRTAFGKWFAHISVLKKSIVIIIDGIEDLQDEDQSLDFVWLPTVIPKGIKVIITCRTDSSFAKLKRKKWKTLSLEPIELLDRSDILVNHLGKFGKRLSNHQISTIVGHEKTGNPLFLKTLLEELRVFGHFEKLNTYLEHYQSSENSKELLVKILKRIENDFEEQHLGLVGEIMCLISASRHGLSEKEMLSILGNAKSQFPTMYWSPIYLALKVVFIKRNGLLTFSHESFKIAVKEYYLDASINIKIIQLKLVNYYLKQNWTDRKIHELPWLYMHLNNIIELAELLSNPSFLAKAIHTSRYEISAYWSYILRSSDISIISAYKQVLKNPKDHQEIVWEVLILIKDLGFLQDLEDTIHDLDELITDEFKQQFLAGFMGQIALNNKHHSKAFEYFIRQEELAKAANVPSALASSLNNQANVLRLQKQFDKALSNYLKAEQIYRQTNDVQGESICIANKALVLMDASRLDEALALFKKQCTLSESISDYSSLCRGRLSQASILSKKKRFKDALKLLTQTEELAKQIGEMLILFKTQSNFATIYQNLANYDEALKKFNEQNLLCMELKNNRLLAINLAEQAKMYALKLNEPAYALSYIREANKLYKEGGFTDLELDIPKLMDVIEALVPS